MGVGETIRGGWRDIREIPSKVLSTLLPRRTVCSRGLRFTLQCDNHITQYRWKSYNTKEPETLDWIDRYMKDGETFFDIGANIGVYTIYAALRHPTARVIAFEPEYANLHLLRDNVMANGLQDRVEIYSIALGNRTGISQLHIQDLTPGAALHTESKDALEVTRTHKPVIWREGICIFTLDAFCEETHVLPHCLKIDVDGTEIEILEGASHTLRSPTLRCLIMEMFGGPATREACARLLQAAGLHREWGNLQTGDNEIWVRDGEQALIPIMNEANAP